MDGSQKKQHPSLQNQRDEEHSANRKNFVRQFPKNLGSNIALFLVNIAIGIWLIPYFIHNLGVAAYGLIPLAMSLTHYVAVVTIAISGGIARFLTIDLQQKDFDRANRTFNTSFWSIVAIITVSIPLLAVFTQFVPVVFKVPADQITSSKWLFAGIIGAFLLTTLSSCFGASTFAYNRLDLRNLANIVRSASRVAFVVLLFTFFNPTLENVALATLLAALSSFAIHYFFWRKLTPDLHISPSYFDKTRLKDLTTFGGWLVVNHVGYLLFLQIDLIVVNRLFGPTAGGEYASVLQWSMLLRSMAGVLSGVAQPMFMICYARGQTEDLIRIAKMAVKFMGLGLALPIGLACGFSSELLTVWIGPEFSKLAPLMMLMLVHLTVNLAVKPLFSINVCYNRVKLPGIVTLLMGGLNLILAIWIPLTFDTGFYGVALAGAIVLTLKNAIFTPWYATHVMGLRTRVFFRQMATGIATTLVIFALGALLSRMYQITSWTQLLVVGTVISALYAPCVWFCVMAPEERKIFLKMIARRRA
jgi:membrane protein EpsK